MKESFRHFEQNKTIDLIGLGNAIVDIIVNIEDEFLETNNLDKGSMNLISSDQSQTLLENCKVIKPNVRGVISKYCCMFSRIR